MNNTPGDFVIATVVGLLAAALAAVAGVIAGIFAGNMFLTGEAAAWDGISVGLPLAGIFAVAAFAFTFRWIMKYGDTHSN